MSEEKPDNLLETIRHRIELAALESLLVEKGLVTFQEIQEAYRNGYREAVTMKVVLAREVPELFR